MADISDVLDATNGKSADLYQSRNEISEQKGSQVTDMGISIDGRTTAVHPEGFAIADDDLSLCSTHGVVKEYPSRYCLRGDHLPERYLRGVEGDYLAILLTHLSWADKVA